MDPENKDELDLVVSRLKKLGVEGLICIGGDGTFNGLQPLAERLPAVLAPKTIDNDLGLNYASEPDEWVRVNDPGVGTVSVQALRRMRSLDLNHMINYVTPGYATAVFVSAAALNVFAPRRRVIAVSRSLKSWASHSGFIALGTAYGRPDIILIPEHPLESRAAHRTCQAPL